MKRLILSFLLSVLSGSLYLVSAQDVIVKENGEEIKAKVIEVGKSDIKYKNFDDPEFATLNIEIEEVKKIRYEDGTEKVFKKNLVKHFVSLSFGGATPTGDFAWNNRTKSSEGYAMSGGVRAALDMGIYVVKNLGIGLSFSGTKLNIDTNGIKQGFQGVGNSNSGFDFYDPRWKIQYLMTGPLYSFKLGKKFALDTRLMIGPLIVKKPSYGFRYYDITSGFTYNYSYGDGEGTTLGLLASTAIRWHFSKKIGMRFSIDYIGGTPNIKYDVRIWEPVPAGTSAMERVEKNELHQRVSIMRGELGIMFLFKR